VVDELTRVSKAMAHYVSLATSCFLLMVSRCDNAPGSDSGITMEIKVRIGHDRYPRVSQRLRSMVHFLEGSA
jgi:hypothetical protein